MYCSTFLVRGMILGICSAGYVLEAKYTAANWWNQFDFFTSKDPTSGFVNYVDRDTANQNGYIDTVDNQVYLGVDYTNNVNGNGRDSVRICSNAVYNYGLVVLDVSHMPGGICGTWPAFWMFGTRSEWPQSGEIDIIEGINDNKNNALTLHTSDGCSIVNDDDFTGTLSTANCANMASGQPDYAGCDIQDQDTLSYGKGFNANGGGVIAMEWTSSVIRAWFFPNGTTPSDLEAGSPDPVSWQKPVAQFQGSCDIPSHFQDMKIIINTDFCGSWAGDSWGLSTYCSSLAPTCADYVRSNPASFQDAYWLINSLNVYQYQSEDGNVVPPPASHGSAAMNETAPLLSTPLAMGGGSSYPPRDKGSRMAKIK